MSTLVTGAFGCIGSWARLQKDGRLDARELA
jgi:hypothetical protein